MLGKKFYNIKTDKSEIITLFTSLIAYKEIMSEEKKYCKFCNTVMEVGSRVSVSKDNPEPDSQGNNMEYFCPNCDAKFVEEILDEQKRRLD
jgi:uncharacterized protein with PIN domain